METTNDNYKKLISDIVKLSDGELKLEEHIDEVVLMYGNIPLTVCSPECYKSMYLELLNYGVTRLHEMELQSRDYEIANY